MAAFRLVFFYFWWTLKNSAELFAKKTNQTVQQRFYVFLLKKIKNNNTIVVDLTTSLTKLSTIWVKIRKIWIKQRKSVKSSEKFKARQLRRKANFKRKTFSIIYFPRQTRFWTITAPTLWHDYIDLPKLTAEKNPVEHRNIPHKMGRNDQKRKQ